MILFLWVSVSKHNKRYNMQTQTQPQTQTQSPLDILQQFDVLLKNHSIVVSDRENLAKLFECIVDLCTQMPKTKLKAALKAATQEPKSTKPRANAKSNPNTKTQLSMVGPEDAGDAPVISDLVAAPVARGRGRPRKATIELAPVATSAVANPNAETAEKKRRGRPKKDKSVTISSNDDEDALIEKMMADVASMQKDEAVIAYPTLAEAVVIADPADEEDDTECEPYSPIQSFAGQLMRCEETTPIAESMSPVVPTSSPSSFQQFEVETPSLDKATKATKAPKATAPKANAAKAIAAKEPKVKAVKAITAKEPNAKVKAAKEPNVKVKSSNENKETNEAKETVVQVAVVAAPAPSFSADSHPRAENKETNGKIYLMAMVPTTSFSYNGKTYLRTETDNVYDNLTHELIGVWDHSNHEIITAFDDEDLYFSEEE